MCARRISSLIFGLIFVVAGAATLFLFARVTELQCTHPEPSEVVCAKEVRWLGLITIKEETIRDVRGASVAESCDEDGCTYRVEMRTGTGTVPLTGYYSSGWREKEETAAQITAYVGQSAEEALEIREGSVFLGILTGGIFIIAGLVIAVRRAIGRFR